MPGTAELPVRELTETGKVLSQALDLLRTYGWVQGRSGNRQDGGYCMLNALRTAARVTTNHVEGTPLYSGAAWALADVIEGMWPADLPAWNDRKSRTFRDVEDAFETAIRKETL